MKRVNAHVRWRATLPGTAKLTSPTRSVPPLRSKVMRTFSVSPGALGPVKAAIARYTGPAA